MIQQILSDPRTLPALLALAAALTALVRSETARLDAANALRRSGGRRRTPPAISRPPAGQQERRQQP